MLDPTYNFHTVYPDAVLPLAALFTCWQYRTAENIIRERYTLVEEYGPGYRLALFELKELYYQKNPIEPWNYRGFLLKLEESIPPDDDSIYDYIYKFQNIYVLKEDVFAIEKIKREYCSIPGGNKGAHTHLICNESTLSDLGTAIFLEICLEGLNNALLEKAKAEIKIPKECFWPWLGPVITNVLPRKQGRKSTIDHDLEEVIEFIRIARALGQNDPPCLAKMLNYRYPNVSLPTLVSIIDPDKERTLSTATKMARRWLYER